MEIIQVKENRFKIFLSTKDLKRYNLSTDTFMSFRFYNNPIILDLFKILPINFRNITFDMYCINNSDFIIFINIVRIFFS